MSRRLVFLALALAALTAACGSGPPAVQIAVQANPSDLPPDKDPQAVLEQTARVINDRLASYGASEISVEVQSGAGISVRVRGVDQAVVERLATEVAVLEFRRPVIDANGYIVCRTAQGDLFGVPPQLVNPDPASRQLARCFGGTYPGQAEWQPAAIDDDGVPRALTPDLIQPGGWSVREDPSVSLVVRFSDDGGRILEALTRALTGYPFGVFLDGRLIAAPRIMRAITNGSAVISGIGLEEARILAAELNSGPLPIRLASATASPAP